MKIRRCAVLYIEPREEMAIDWAALFAGASTLAASTRWLALAPHMDREIEVHAADLAVLGSVSQAIWSERAASEQRFDAASIERLLELGLIVSDSADPAHAAIRERDETLRATHWRPLSALSHTFGRWRGVSAETGMHAPSFQELLDSYGEPPPATFEVGTAAEALKLPEVSSGLLDEVLFKRYTGRNFDLQASLPLPVVARLLQRTFGAQQLRQVGPHTSVLKKTSPSGGALHPVEAFVLMQRVDGVEPGLYHYHPIDHALRPVRTMTRDEAAALALYMLADQQWLAEAPMQVVMVARLERLFWKYRNHHKALRATGLDAGHLSQTFYLLAAEAGLSAFITAAINDADIETMLNLDHLRHAVIAVGGCGLSSNQRNMAELRYGETGAL
jgi:putative peptide maturation dehydrogenase